MATDKPKFQIIRNAANIWLPYLFILFMAIIGIIALQHAFIPPVENTQPKINELQKPYRPVTRSAVDSTAVAQLRATETQVTEQKPRNIDFNAITTLLVAVTGAIITLANKINTSKDKTFRQYVEQQFKEVFMLLEDVKDYGYKKDIDIKLRQIEFDAAGFTDSQMLKDLIEGITSRTRSIVRDTAIHQYNEEAYQKTVMKIGARIAECKNQVKDLGFDDDFQNEANKIRCAAVKSWKDDLQRLSDDNIYNDKYSRYQDIACKFLRSFLRDIIKAHIANQRKDVA